MSSVKIFAHAQDIEPALQETNSTSLRRNTLKLRQWTRLFLRLELGVFSRAPMMSTEWSPRILGTWAPLAWSSPTGLCVSPFWESTSSTPLTPLSRTLAAPLVSLSASPLSCSGMLCSFSSLLLARNKLALIQSVFALSKYSYHSSLLCNKVRFVLIKAEKSCLNEKRLWDSPRIPCHFSHQAH